MELDGRLMKDFNENILIIISASSLVKFFGSKSDSQIDVNYGFQNNAREWSVGLILISNHLRLAIWVK